MLDGYTTFDDVLAEKMKDPEFKAAWEAEKPAFERQYARFEKRWVKLLRNHLRVLRIEKLKEQLNKPKMNLHARAIRRIERRMDALGVYTRG